MKTLLKLITLLLSLFNSVGAIYGGWNLIIHPDGSSIQLSLEWLKHTHFDDYLIPGIILFIANGLFGAFVFFATIFNYRYFSWLVIAQGLILTGWILIQIILIETIYFLHPILGAIGITLIILGILQKNK